MKFAVVKSSVYQDLWVNDITNNFYDIFKTSMMRCPPIGLAESYQADFIIVKESNEYPCQFNKNVLPESCKDNMKFSCVLKNPTLPFLDETFHKEISIDSVAYSADSIQWDKYDIILCINTCVPCRIIKKYPKQLWCYWVGENDDHLMNKLIGDYDIILNQDVTKKDIPEFSVGFPYTFLGPTTMESMAKTYFGLDSIKKHGIFMEINNTSERPVKTIPSEFSKISTSVNMPIILHSQNIIENAKNLHKAKYYVKLLGRTIRGNSVLEAISTGTLLLANRNLVVFNDLILPECHINNVDDVCKKILYYEENPDEYARVVNEQRRILKQKYFIDPINKLIDKYNLFKAKTYQLAIVAMNHYHL